MYNNYRRFVRARQLFTLELVHSISARTVLVTNLPNHLQGDRALAEYFENMGLAVESVSVCRRVDTLKTLLDKRTDALLKLESKWVDYVGNPSTVESYDPSDNAGTADPSIVESQPGRLVVPHHNRPTLRPGWFKAKVDALEWLEARFQEADEKVKKWRKSGKFRSSHAAFVTFEKMTSAVSIFRINVSQVLTQFTQSKLLVKQHTLLFRIGSTHSLPLNLEISSGLTCPTQLDQSGCAN